LDLAKKDTKLAFPAVDASPKSRKEYLFYANQKETSCHKATGSQEQSQYGLLG